MLSDYADIFMYHSPYTYSSLYFNDIILSIVSYKYIYLYISYYNIMFLDK